MARLQRIAQIETLESAFRHELRMRRYGLTDAEYEICQMPATTTPQVASVLRLLLTEPRR